MSNKKNSKLPSTVMLVVIIVVIILGLVGVTIGGVALWKHFQKPEEEPGIGLEIVEDEDDLGEDSYFDFEELLEDSKEDKDDNKDDKKEDSKEDSKENSKEDDKTQSGDDSFGRFF